MLPLSSDHQQPQQKRRGSILQEPVPATGNGSASSSGTHLSGAQDLHTELVLSCMPVSARKRARGREHMETKTMKREDDRSRLIVLLSITKSNSSCASCSTAGGAVFSRATRASVVGQLVQRLH